MKKVFFLSLGISWSFIASGSNSLQDFKLSECQKAQCMEMSGPVAYLSVKNTMMVGSEMKLVILQNEKKKKYACDRFQYDRKTKLLICDNEGRGKNSFTVDSTFAVTKFRL